MACKGSGVRTPEAPSFHQGVLCPMRARDLDRDRRLEAKLQVSRPTRQRAPAPSQGGSAGSNPVGATTDHQHNSAADQQKRGSAAAPDRRSCSGPVLARTRPRSHPALMAGLPRPGRSPSCSPTSRAPLGCCRSWGIAMRRSATSMPRSCATPSRLAAAWRSAPGDSFFVAFPQPGRGGPVRGGRSAGPGRPRVAAGAAGAGPDGPAHRGGGPGRGQLCRPGREPGGPDRRGRPRRQGPGLRRHPGAGGARPAGRGVLPGTWARTG